jgi:hypothetical protein
MPVPNFGVLTDNDFGITLLKCMENCREDFSSLDTFKEAVGKTIVARLFLKDVASIIPILVQWTCGRS